VSGNQTHSASLGNRVGLHYSRFRLFARANSLNNQWFTDSIRVQNRHFRTRIREDGLAGEALGITIQPSAGGHGGTFIPEGIRWVVERSLAWISRYRRLNTIFERTEGHLVAFIEIAFISILSRRLVRLGTQEISA